jgi:hypothetical protein
MTTSPPLPWPACRGRRSPSMGPGLGRRHAPPQRSETGSDVPAAAEAQPTGSSSTSITFGLCRWVAQRSTCPTSAPCAVRVTHVSGNESLELGSDGASHGDGEWDSLGSSWPPPPTVAYLSLMACGAPVSLSGPFPPPLTVDILIPETGHVFLQSVRAPPLTVDILIPETGHVFLQSVRAPPLTVAFFVCGQIS